MAEFSEVVKQYTRMCRLSTCEECVMHDMDGFSCWGGAKENPEEFERRVTDWAKEHPEPAYPTWSEWLVAMRFGLYRDIPADIAKKLGIKPKEANHD